jgi:hypothetical protein
MLFYCLCPPSADRKFGEDPVFLHSSLSSHSHTHIFCLPLLVMTLLSFIPGKKTTLHIFALHAATDHVSDYSAIPAQYMEGQVQGRHKCSRPWLAEETKDAEAGSLKLVLLLKEYKLPKVSHMVTSSMCSSDMDLTFTDSSSLRDCGIRRQFQACIKSGMGGLWEIFKGVWEIFERL